MLAKEVVDLSEPDRILMMDLRRQVEHVVREVTQPGKGSVSITAIEPVGHYAIRIVFSDGHGAFIRGTCCNRFARTSRGCGMSIWANCWQPVIPGRVGGMRRW